MSPINKGFSLFTILVTNQLTIPALAMIKSSEFYSLKLYIMKYTISNIIDKPIDEVAAKFMEPDGALQ